MLISLEVLPFASLALGITAIILAAYLYLRLKKRVEEVEDIMKGYEDLIAKRIYESEVSRATKAQDQVMSQQQKGPQERLRITPTELEILRLCQQPSTARDIQQKLGLTREHITRELKKLYEMGLIERATQDKPFKYIITERGKEAIGVG